MEICIRTLWTALKTATTSFEIVSVHLHLASTDMLLIVTAGEGCTPVSLLQDRSLCSQLRTG